MEKVRWKIFLTLKCSLVDYNKFTVLFTVLIRVFYVYLSEIESFGIMPKLIYHKPSLLNFSFNL